MNALLYGLVVVIWGTTWIAIFLQQGPVAAPVSIFWRFAVACATIMIVLIALRRLRKLALRDHLLSVTGWMRFLLQLLVFLYRRRAHQYRTGVGDFLDGRTV